ncbi:hypothetical protein ABFY59_29605 [Priestia aryabhattai]|uniref:hypothetical protein n=1 Tax=Priestia aryabhattai TaxID=412384 RepID=UPI003D28CB69
MFNKKKDLPSVVAIVILAAFILVVLAVAVSLPVFGFHGLMNIFEKFQLKNLLYINYFDRSIFNVLYILLALSAGYSILMILEVIFIILKQRNIIKLSSLYHRLLSFVLLVCCGFLLTRVVVLGLFQRIHCSNTLLLIAFLLIYAFFFLCSETYRKQEAIL